MLHLVNTLAIQADTLTESYSDQWQASEQMNEAPALIQWLSSNDLVFVVLGVSLLIWLILLFFLVRLDRKVGQLEHKLEDKIHEENGPSDTRSTKNDR